MIYAGTHSISKKLLLNKKHSLGFSMQTCCYKDYSSLSVDLFWSKKHKCHSEVVYPDWIVSIWFSGTFDQIICIICFWETCLICLALREILSNLISRHPNSKLRKFIIMFERERERGEKGFNVNVTHFFRNSFARTFWHCDNIFLNRARWTTSAISKSNLKPLKVVELLTLPKSQANKRAIVTLTYKLFIDFHFLSLGNNCKSKKVCNEPI